MESGDTFNCAQRVKQEPSDVSLDDNEDYQTEFPQLMHKNPIQSIKQEYDEMPESQEDMEIVFELFEQSAPAQCW
ncbi:hypothetical protein TKK_0005345 [Trichogramma kaykai]